MMPDVFPFDVSSLINLNKTEVFPEEGGPENVINFIAYFL
jgi:hypothetical protein